MTILQQLPFARLLGVLSVLLVLPISGFAGIRSERPSQIQYLSTSLGSGLSLAYNLGDHLSVGANYFGLAIEGEGDNSDNNETVKVDFATFEFQLRYYLFENSGFYLAGAGAYRNWKITVTGSDTIGNSGEVAEYTLTAEWPTTAVSYGVGFNWIADFGLSGGIYLGMISGGNPELKGSVNNKNISQADVDREVDEIEEEENFGERYANVTIIAFSIGYNF